MFTRRPPSSGRTREVDAQAEPDPDRRLRRGTTVQEEGVQEEGEASDLLEAWGYVPESLLRLQFPCVQGAAWASSPSVTPRLRQEARFLGILPCPLPWQALRSP